MNFGKIGFDVHDKISSWIYSQEDLDKAIRAAVEEMRERAAKEAERAIGWQPWQVAAAIRKLEVK